jgi:uncharacterized protein YdgA (DUF945 family)
MFSKEHISEAVSNAVVHSGLVLALEKSIEHGPFLLEQALHFALNM